jgi:endonuclease YncB( thermonuclease family)
MAITRIKPERRAFFEGYGPLLLIGLAVLVLASLNLGSKNNESGPTILPTANQVTSRIDVSTIQVIDGDTIRASGQVYRLVGFDAPESGLHARCESERALAARATSRLRQIVATGGLQLNRVACACPAGTEGTHRCNYGRLCGVLTTAGRDVGALLVREGLARLYVCAGTRCPPRQGWC